MKDTNSRRILVVDDEKDIRELVRDVLEPYGHEVTCVESGIEALEEISRQEFDVVYLDVRMPGCDGLTALENIRIKKPTLPIIMVTGCVQQSIIDDSMTLGATAYLAKPFGIRDIVSMLEIVLPAA